MVDMEIDVLSESLHVRLMPQLSGAGFASTTKDILAQGPKLSNTAHASALIHTEV